jgi:hypothetical protein
MIKVYEENGTYDIDVYANEKEEERNNSIMGLTIDTKRHMYYVVLPEESFRSESEKVIVDSIKMDILKKNYISEIAKDPKNVSLSGETKVYEKEILKNIFILQGIVPVTYAERDQIASDLEDIKAYNLGIKSENDIFRMR